MSVSQGDEKKHNIDSIVDAGVEGRNVPATEFSYLVDQIAKEITDKRGGVGRAYSMISAELPSGPRPTPEEIARYHLGSRQVPLALYTTAKNILRTLNATARRVGKNGDLRVWERTPDARERLSDKLGYPSPETLPEGKVPSFAFNAWLKRVVEHTSYDSINKAGNESARRQYCSARRFRQAAEIKDDCDADVYMAAVKLVLTHMGITDEQLAKVESMQIHSPMHYAASLNYIPGQILVFSDDAGSVLDKSGKGRILVAQYSGKHGEYVEREYVEGLQHDTVRNKFGMSGIVGMDTSSLNASIRRHSGAQ